MTLPPHSPSASIVCLGPRRKGLSSTERAHEQMAVAVQPSRERQPPRHQTAPTSARRRGAGARGTTPGAAPPFSSRKKGPGHKAAPSRTGGPRRRSCPRRPPPRAPAPRTPHPTALPRPTAAKGSRGRGPPRPGSPPPCPRLTASSQFCRL